MPPHSTLLPLYETFVIIIFLQYSCKYIKYLILETRNEPHFVFPGFTVPQSLSGQRREGAMSACLPCPVPRQSFPPVTLLGVPFCLTRLSFALCCL